MAHILKRLNTFFPIILNIILLFSIIPIVFSSHTLLQYNDSTEEDHTCVSNYADFYAVKFNLPSSWSNAIVTSIEVFESSLAPPDGDGLLTIHFYDSSLTTELAPTSGFLVFGSTNGWQLIVMSTPTPVIVPSEFYFATEWSDGLPCIGLDTDSPNGRTYKKMSGGDWTQVNDYNIMFRVTVLEAPPTSANATDSTGRIRDVFLSRESVYATGSGFKTSTPVDIYVVYDREWDIGDAIKPDISSDGINTVTTDVSGNLGPVLIWPSPLILGSYDVVFDVDPDGYYSFGDGIDHPNHPGFIVSSLDPGSSVVGGFYVTAINYVVLLPYLTLVSLACVVSAILIIRKKRKS
jgi:hypothetical protein